MEPENMARKTNGVPSPSASVKNMANPSAGSPLSPTEREQTYHKRADTWRGDDADSKAHHERADKPFSVFAADLCPEMLEDLFRTAQTWIVPVPSAQPQ